VLPRHFPHHRLLLKRSPLDNLWGSWPRPVVLQSGLPATFAGAANNVVRRLRRTLNPNLVESAWKVGWNVCGYLGPPVRLWSFFFLFANASAHLLARAHAHPRRLASSSASDSGSIPISQPPNDIVPELLPELPIRGTDSPPLASKRLECGLECVQESSSAGAPFGIILVFFLFANALAQLLARACAHPRPRAPMSPSESRSVPISGSRPPDDLVAPEVLSGPPIRGTDSAPLGSKRLKRGLECMQESSPAGAPLVFICFFSVC
jgi:hypothetical protein